MKQHDPIEFTVPSGDIKRPRRLLKGGGGGDGGAAARKAAEDARIASAIKRINQIFAVDKFQAEPVDSSAFMQEQRQPGSVPAGYTLVPGQVEDRSIPNIWGGAPLMKTVNMLFNKAAYDSAVEKSRADAERKNAEAMAGREGLYTKIGEDTKANALLDLNKDRALAERDLGFMLARQGLSGGSRDVDVNRDVLDTHQRGVLRAANMGSSAANNARSADDQTRVKLIQSIQAGLDEGSAMQQAYEGMRNNSRAAQDQANMATLAGFFDTLVNQQRGAAYGDGFTQVANPYARTARTAASPAIGGDRGTTRSY